MERKKLIYIETDGYGYDTYGLYVRVTYRNIFKKLKVKWVCVLTRIYEYKHKEAKIDDFLKKVYNDLDSVYGKRRLNWIRNRRYDIEKNKLKYHG